MTAAVLENPQKSKAKAKPSPLKQSLDTLQNAFFNQPKTTLANRRSKLRKLHQALHAHTDALCAAEHEDFGNKNAQEICLTEIAPVMEHIRYVKSHLAQWMKPARRSLAYYFQPGRVEVRHEPLGCVGIIVPWNYPINLSLVPLIDAIAAGNRVMLKLSEYAPATAAAIQALIEEAFTPEEVQIVTGDAKVASEFAQLPFDHLFYTGSTAVGKHVMAAAAKNLTPVTLELGGKSPCFLSRSADFKASVEKLAFGKCINGGQTCVAPDVLFCPEEKLEAFCSTYFNAIENMYPNLAENTDYTHIINDKHHKRLTSLIEDARAKGARVLTFREESQKSVAHRGLFPTLVLDVTDNMRLWDEEIFGPILVVKTYQNTEEALNKLRQWPSPLAFYIFSADRHETERLIANTKSGGVCVNDTLIHVAVDDAPFGGVGPSGFGRYHGPEGFKTFSNARTVLMRPSMNLVKVLYPPYGTKLQRFFFKTLLRNR